MATSATGDSVTNDLAAAFAALEQQEAEPEASPEAKTEEAEIPEVKTEEEKADPEKTDDKAEEKAEEDKDPEKDEKSEEETEEDDGDPAAFKPLTQEEFDEKFNPRNNTKGLVKYATAAAAEAGKLQAVLNDLGGEPFIEPLKQMSAALQEQTPESLVKFFVGVNDAAGADTLVQILGQAMYMGFVKADEWIADPRTAGFGEQVKALAEASIEGRFGVTSERLQKMAEWEKIGWFDKLDEWTANNYVPPTELDEMLEINSNPTLKRLAEENQALKKTQAKDTGQPEAGAADNTDEDFGVFTGEQIKKVLTDVAWASSPLRDLKSDTPEMKEDKQLFRENLEKAALAEFHKLPARSKLASEYRNGKSTTSVFRSEMTKALDAIITATAPQMAQAEKTLTRLYGKTARKEPPPPPKVDPAPPEKPTVPTDFKPPAGPTTIRQVDKDLEAAFTAFG